MKFYIVREMDHEDDFLVKGKREYCGGSINLKAVDKRDDIMSLDKFKAAEKALKRFEKLYGSEVLKIFSIANGYISRELTDGMVAGVPQRTMLDDKYLWVVPIILAQKAGVYGEIGVILIDDKTHSILGTTAKPEILQKAKVLLDEEAEAI